MKLISQNKVAKIERIKLLVSIFGKIQLLTWIMWCYNYANITQIANSRNSLLGVRTVLKQCQEIRNTTKHTNKVHLNATKCSMSIKWKDLVKAMATVPWLTIWNIFLYVFIFRLLFFMQQLIPNSHMRHQLIVKLVATAEFYLLLPHEFL